LLTRRHLLSLFGAGAAGCGVYGWGIEPTWLKTAEVEIALASLPAELDGYTIAQVSDLHVGCGLPRPCYEQAIAVANAAAPDLAVVTGDLVDGGGTGEDAATAALLASSLRAREGAFAVLGNHDTGAYRPTYTVDAPARSRLVAALADVGVTLLHNAACTLPSGLRLAGFGDLWSREFEPDRVPLRDERPVIALSHHPDTAQELAARGADLILSGHTHGGQICLPLLGPPYVPVRNKQFLSGRFDLEPGAQLYVNPGVGYTTLGIRFGARPEVTILRLRRARDAGERV